MKITSIQSDINNNNNNDNDNSNNINNNNNYIEVSTSTLVELAEVVLKNDVFTFG